MRYATKEERESVNRYVESISKPTGINFFNLIKSKPVFKKDKKSSNLDNEDIHVGVYFYQEMDKLNRHIVYGPLYSRCIDLMLKDNDVSYIYISKISNISKEPYYPSKDEKHIQVYIPYGFLKRGYYNAIRSAESYKDHHFIIDGYFSKDSSDYINIKDGDKYILKNYPDMYSSGRFSHDEDSTFFIQKGKPKQSKIYIKLQDLDNSKEDDSKFIAIYDPFHDHVIESYIAPSCNFFDDIFDNHPYLLCKDDNKYYITEVY